MIEFNLAPLLEDHGLPLAIMGVVVVFAALILVVLFITILPRIVKRMPAQDRQESGGSQAAFGDQPSEDELVVIAAAVAEVVHGPHRILRIRGLTAEDLGWSLEGRIKHHQSHTIPHRDRR